MPGLADRGATFLSGTKHLGFKDAVADHGMRDVIVVRPGDLSVPAFTVSAAGEEVEAISFSTLLFPAAAGAAATPVCVIWKLIKVVITQAAKQKIQSAFLLLLLLVLIIPAPFEFANVPSRLTVQNLWAAVLFQPISPLTDFFRAGGIKRVPGSLLRDCGLTEASPTGLLGLTAEDLLQET